MSTPQLILTLAPGGQLVVELPGANGSRRQVKLEGSDEDIIASLLRMLQAQLRSQISIGLDGAPTQAQARHWTRHQGLWGDPSCPFCISEGRFGAKRKTTRTDKGSAKGSVKSNKVVVPDPAGGLIPVLMTRREARKHGWRPAPQASSANLSDTGL